MLSLGNEVRKLGLPVGGILLALVGGLVQNRCKPISHFLPALLENNNCALLQPLCLNKLREVSLEALTKIVHIILYKSPDPRCRATVEGIALDLSDLLPVLVQTRLLLSVRVLVLITRISYLIARVYHLVLVALISCLLLLVICLSEGG